MRVGTYSVEVVKFAHQKNNIYAPNRVREVNCRTQTNERKNERETMSEMQKDDRAGGRKWKSTAAAYYIHYDSRHGEIPIKITPTNYYRKGREVSVNLSVASAKSLSSFLVKSSSANTLYYPAYNGKRRDATGRGVGEGDDDERVLNRINKERVGERER